MKRILLSMLVGLTLSGAAFAQDDLLSELQSEDSAKVKDNLTIATFKSTRIINMHSVEMTGVGNLQFMIIHHFGEIWNENEKWANFARLFGMNGGTANTYMSFDYSPVKWLNLGVGFAGFSQLEGTAKFKILHQQTGRKNIPVSLVWLSTFNFNASKQIESPNNFYWNRFSYLHQLLIARKFTDRLSLQLMPSLVHRNIVAYGYDNAHNVFSIGLGGRYKIKDKTAVTFEYSRQLNNVEILDKTGEVVDYNPNLISVGYDWDTGGHIFQFFISNTQFASNVPQLSNNPKSDFPGGWSIGFNLNRSYTVKKKVQVH